MQLTNYKSQAYMMFILFFVAGIAIAGEHSKSFEGTVELLYKRYSWTAIFSAQEHKSTDIQLKNENIDILNKFFVSDLASAIKADSDCAGKTEEICIVDFDILFDSQDTEVSDLVINYRQGNSVDVCFKNASTTKPCVTHIGRVENNTHKIFDLIYQDGRSLRKLLGLQTL